MMWVCRCAGGQAKVSLACSLEADLSESICFCISAAASCASSASCVARVGIEGMCGREGEGRKEG